MFIQLHIKARVRESRFIINCLSFLLKLLNYYLQKDQFYKFGVGFEIFFGGKFTVRQWNVKYTVYNKFLV